MRLLSLTALLIASTSAVPAAVPVPVPYPGTCTSYPGWMRTPDADVTGWLRFIATNSEDATYENFHLQPFYNIPWGSGTRDQLGLDFRPSGVYRPEQYFQCIDGKIKYADSILAISTNSNAAQILVDARENTYTPELYYLEVDGKRLDGVYLGAKNQTTWGFYEQPAQCAANGVSSMDFFGAKLLGLSQDAANPPTAAPAAQFKGFLKVVTP